MFEPVVAAHIEVAERPDRLSISAFIAGAGSKRLTWRLESVSRSSGGSSTVSQSGVVDQPRETPVAVLGVTPGSQGEVILRVFDGEREVASDKIDLSALPAATDGR